MPSRWRRPPAGEVGGALVIRAPLLPLPRGPKEDLLAQRGKETEKGKVGERKEEKGGGAWKDQDKDKADGGAGAK